MSARDLTVFGEVATMTSLELVEFVNADRLANCTFEKPYVELAHRSFMAKVPAVLGEGCAKFLAYHRNPQNGQEYAIYELPKREACLMAMSYSYELQAKVFDKMTAMETQVVDPLANLPAEQRALIAVMLDNADIKRVQAEQGASILAIEHRVNEAADAQLLHARPTNAENMGMIRARINKKHGLSASIIDQVMRQSLYAPKPAGMVKNGHENAQGGSYAVYWTKDITALFARFTAECAPTTATQYTHPLIDGKFKMSGGAV